MDSKSDKANTEIRITEPGVYLKGIVVSSSCRLLNKKDGSGQLVIIKHEFATQPGLAVWEEFLDPARNPGLKIRGNEVVEWPRLENLKPMIIKAERFKVINETLHISNATVIS